MMSFIHKNGDKKSTYAININKKRSEPSTYPCGSRIPLRVTHWVSVQPRPEHIFSLQEARKRLGTRGS